jgi:hypothetical protein
VVAVADAAHGVPAVEPPCPTGTKV